jgi:lipopolysaccharide export system protein LptA
LSVSGTFVVAEEPISVEADHMSSTEQTNSVLFTGDVYVEQGDLEVRSDKMTVFYTDLESGQKKAANTTQKIEKLICEGNVKITQKDWLGTADKMTYYANKRQVILSGNAQAWQDQNKIAGEKIVYYMDEGRSEVVGGTSVTVADGEKKKEKSRVKMTILQK